MPAYTTLVRAVRGEFLPNRVMALSDPTSEAADKPHAIIPVLEGKTLAGGAAGVHMCGHFCLQKACDRSERTC
jgi:hypothetical protein